jgi:hypothetical protein
MTKVGRDKYEAVNSDLSSFCDAPCNRCPFIGEREECVAELTPTVLSEHVDGEEQSVNFYWTDSVTGRGSYVYAKKEIVEGIMNKYFEASVAPLPGVKYPETAAPWPGISIRK